MEKRVVNTAGEPLHYLIAEAHRGVLHPDDYNVEPIIDSIIARLERAKAASASGDKVTASREFDPRYEVKV